MKFLKEIAWCVATMLGIVIVTLLLLMLGAALGEEVKPTPKEKIITCEPVGKGWSKCKTEWI